MADLPRNDEIGGLAQVILKHLVHEQTKTLAAKTLPAFKMFSDCPQLKREMYTGKAHTKPLVHAATRTEQAYETNTSHKLCP